MTRLILVPCLLVACAFAQSPPPPAASISGQVRVNRMPVPNATVTISGRENETRRAETDETGYFSFTDLPPGRVTLQLRLKSGMVATTSTELKPGRNPNWNVDLTESVRVSGRIVDNNKAPLKGATVYLIDAEYMAGGLRYFTASSANSNEAGEYVVVAPPRGAFYILARKPGMMPTYFPGVESIDGASPLTVPAGGLRDLVDIEMRSAPSHCIEGKIVTPLGEKPALYEIGENDPPLWAVSSRFSVNARVPSGEDGEFKVCALHSGNYWIKTYSSSDVGREHAIEYVTIGDKDVSGIVTGPKPQFPVDLVVVWDGDSDPSTQLDNMSVSIASTIGEFGNIGISVSGTLPRRLSLPVWNHGFILRVQYIPAGAYLKDVTYGGRSILNEVFQPGSAPAPDGLRIVLARDGGRVSVKTADKDGKPVYDANVVLIPATLTTEAAAASAMITAKSDVNGSWTSGPIAPGKYYVIATTSAVTRSPEVFGKLWRARSSSDVIEVAPNSTAQLTRIPTPIE